MEEQIMEKTNHQIIDNNKKASRLVLVGLLIASLFGNGILGLMIIDRSKGEQAKKPEEVVTVKQGKIEEKQLTLTSYNGVRFQYPNNWQIVDQIFLKPSEGAWLETEKEEIISINEERNHLWGPFGIATDLTLTDMVLKDQDLKAEDYAKKIYENYAENRSSMGEVKPMKLNKQLSPTGLNWWRLDGYEMTENAPSTFYFAEYTKTINQVNIGTVETKKHILQLIVGSTSNIGERDTPQTLEMMEKIIKTLTVPLSEIPKSESKIGNNALSYEDIRISFKVPEGWIKQKELKIMEEDMIIYSKPDSNSEISFGRTPNEKKDGNAYDILERYYYKGPQARKNPRLEDIYIGGELGVRSPVETIQAYGNKSELTMNSFHVLSPDKSILYSFRRTTSASDGASIRVGGWALEELISTVRFKK